MTPIDHVVAFARLALTSSLLLALPTASAAVTILECDFDSEPIDEILANGGAEAGQPNWLGGIDAYVRATPFPTPSVQVSDHWGSGAKYILFSFLNSWTISTGQMSIQADLWFAIPGNYGINLREFGGFSVSFLTLYFTQTGDVRYADLDTTNNPLIGTYAIGQSQVLRIDIDLDAATYDLSLGSTQLLTGESMGALPEGIARILIGHTSDADASGTFYLGDLLVTATETPSPVEPTSWGRVKGLFR
jgi:hypothetical protein